MDDQNKTGEQDTDPVTPPLSVNEGVFNHVEVAQPLSRSERFKHVFYQLLIGCLLVAAVIAVAAVLAGGFTSTLGRALGTIAMVAIHATLSFSYIAAADKQEEKNGGRIKEIFSNAVFTLIVLSFITSIFAIWQIISGTITYKLYASYGLLLFSTLHTEVLYRIRKLEKRIDNIETANFFMMAIVVVMLFVIIFSNDRSALGSFYYRLLAASAIVDATMTITVVIMHKMYLQKHPAAQASGAKSKNFWRHPLIVLILIFLAVQAIGSIVALALHGF